MEIIIAILVILLALSLFGWWSHNHVNKEAEKAILQALSFITVVKQKDAEDDEVNFLACWYMMRTGYSLSVAVQSVGNTYLKVNKHMLGNWSEKEIAERMAMLGVLAKNCPESDSKRALEWFLDGRERAKAEMKMETV